MFFWLASVGVFCRKYEIGESTTIFANVVGIRNSPLEMSSFSHLPFCFTPRSKPTIADSLLGNPMTDIGIVIEFHKETQDQEICSMVLTEATVKEFTRLFETFSWGQFYIEDLPSWCRIGDAIGRHPKIFTKFVFTLGYNDHYITEFNATSSEPVDLVPDQNVVFKYSVLWHQSDIPYPQRLETLNDHAFYNHRVHFYSVINSALLVLLLIALVVILITNTLARDYKRFMQEAEFDGFDVDIALDIGWRTLHGDVFRPPLRMPLVSVLGGAGMQCWLGAIVFGCLMLFHCRDERDGAFYAVILAALVSSPFGGFWAVSFGRVYGYLRWLRLAFQSVSVVPLCLFVCYSISGLFGALRGWVCSFAPAPVMFLTLIQVLVVLPLAGLGGAAAMRLKMFEGNKCEVSLIPRSIPKAPWYTRKLPMTIAIGLICASSIIVEVYYILTAISQSTWLYTWRYFLAGALSLGAVSICATILALYLLLQNENHHWQWFSFSAPASTGIFIFIYCLVFMVGQIRGLFARTVFFLYSLAFSFLVSLFTGGVGFCAGNVFVHQLYTNLKLD